MILSTRGLLVRCIFGEVSLINNKVKFRTDSLQHFRYNQNMFRPMRRFKQQITDAECKEILKNEKRGVLSLLGDGGYPYGLPMSHLYSEEDNKIYFHGAKEGHKIDAIKNCDKASW